LPFGKWPLDVMLGDQTVDRFDIPACQLRQAASLWDM
jgi:hypothetical protein